MLDPATLRKVRPSSPPLQGDPTEPRGARPSSAILALIGPACRPDVLARALRVLRKSPPEQEPAVRALSRTLLDGIERRAPTEWWALAECALALGAIGTGDQAAARTLDEALGAALLRRPQDGRHAEELAHAIVRGLAMVGSAGRVAVPTLSVLLRDAVLSRAAEATLGALDATAQIDLSEAIECAEVAATEPPAADLRRVRPLPREDVVCLGAARKAALRHTRGKPGALPDAIVRAIASALPDGTEPTSEDEQADLAFELGVLWGDQIVRTAGWEWMELSWETWSAPAIVSPDRAHACFPMRLIADAIETDRPALVEQVFRRIRRGDLPDAEPGDLAVIG